MFDVSRDEITGGAILPSLLTLAAPLVVQNYVLVANQIIDLFWVGRLGEPAVAALGLLAPLIALSGVTLHIVFVGGQVLTSQRIGAEDEAGARQILFHDLVLAFALNAIMLVVVLVVADEVVGLLGPGDAVAPLAITYLTVYAFGLIPAAMSDAIEGAFVGWGDSRAALYINVTVVAVNIILDPLLILGLGPFPSLGMYGAALATVFGYVGGFLLALALAASSRRQRIITRDALELDAEVFYDIVDVGGPAAGQNVGRQTARLIIVAVVSAVGGAAGLAAYTIGARVATVAFVPAQGLAQAAASMVGQNLGAAKPERANRVTWTGVAIAVVGLSVFAVVQWIFPVEIARVFVPDISGDGLALAVAYLQILAYGYWALGAIYTVQAGFNGARKTRISMVSTMIQYWAVRVPIAVGGAYILGWGVIAVFWAVTLSNVAAAVGVSLYYWYSANRGMLDEAAEVAASG